MNTPTPSSFVGITKLPKQTGLALAYLRSIRYELPHLKRGRRQFFDPEQVRAWLRDRATAAATPARMAVVNLAPDPHAAARCTCKNKDGTPCKNIADREDEAGRAVCHFHDPMGKAQANVRRSAARRQRMNGGGL